MKIISANLNGIRSAHRKGFFEWMPRQDADIICIQETKAQTRQLDQEILSPAGYHSCFADAEKKGYSGVAIYSRREPDRVVSGLGEGFEDMDAEGRYIQADFGSLSVASIYLPSGSAKDERQLIKFDFMRRLEQRMNMMRKEQREYILCGDWNIVHREIDIRNFRSNQKNSGCLPEERAWLDKLFGPMGWQDAFRVVNQQPDQYTWWSNRGQAWANNVGWRIDYQIITPGLKERVRDASVYKEQRFSDHAPLTLEYEYEL